MGKNKNKTPIPEETKILLLRALKDFQSSKDTAYTFDASLSNFERALVHETCRKMGMTSRSGGLGSARRITVYKRETKSDEKIEKLTVVKFSEESKEALYDLFMRHPPGDGEEQKKMIGGTGVKVVANSRRKTTDIFLRPSMSKADIAQKVQSLASRVKNVAALTQITKDRSKLPITCFKDAITSTIESHQVVLISGETGCGKTTQVPQFLLDYVWGKGEVCKIVCTQPRRISAMSVAERISSERGQNIGEDIGYKIRLESAGGRHSSIVFCTNGILARILVSNGVNTEATMRHKNQEISEITHIIVDEIHERDRYSDFMLAIMRDALPSYPHLRLILMSATLDADRFSQYFGGCPIIRVPGFTYPVKTYYLEDVLSIIHAKGNDNLGSNISGATREESELIEEDKLVLDDAINLAWLNDEFDPLLELVSTEGTQKVYNYQHSGNGLTALMVFAGKGRVGDVCMLLSFGADCHLRANDGTTALELAEKKGQQETAEILKQHMQNALTSSLEEKQLVDKYLERINSEHTDVVLIGKLLMKICTDSQDGAILVFLSGWDDINKTRDILLMNPLFKDTSKFNILSLHSMIPSQEQKKVFKCSPPGCRKIVLSTNIAETAITIDDVVYVIDSGRMKEKSYDPYNNVSTLQSSWVSKASARQREGRAGRCQPGICYHLYSKVRAASLPEFQVPEMRRMPIEELCLQVKLLDPDCKIDDFLQKTLDPPVRETIRNAIIILQDIGALSGEEKLTELGAKLGSLPVHPVICRMLFFAVLMNCLDPALTLACAADYKDPFTLPMSPYQKKKANDAKYKFASMYGGHSDQLAVVAAFECWKTAKLRHQGGQFCAENFVSSSTMSMLNGMRKQLQNELIQTGLIPENISSCSLNARNSGILHAVLVAGLYPKVGRLLRPYQKDKRIFVKTAGNDKVRLHTQSINSTLSFEENDSPLVMYDEVTRGDGGMFIKNCTVVGPLPLLFLSTEIAVAPDDSVDDDDNNNDDFGSDNESDEDKVMSSPENSVVVIVDRWLYFKSTALDIAHIYLLKERLSAAILFKVKNPKTILPPILEASVSAIARVLSCDGLSGVSFLNSKIERSLNNTPNFSSISGRPGTATNPREASSYGSHGDSYKNRHKNGAG
ncbi:DExH-box ATP-dependent RNA helicase DExH6 [Cannabis sativa]|uniref:DExH-box ATP-dependent RNA helicase DExH6 n=1 Tax=Cannabis sativa TaxID=3483 RepID=UPI0029CA1690|nr:DExH-box ATP-dependent RNA helicase DExH6 [Cannabis sativa]